MATLFFAKISSLNKKKGTADITLTDRENQVVTQIPIVRTQESLPAPGSMVAVLLEETAGRIEKGVILGKIS